MFGFATPDLSKLRSGGYGELYENTSGTNMTLNTAGTWYKWTSSSEGQAVNKQLVNVSAENDEITIGTLGAGMYQIAAQFSFGGTNNTLVHGAVFKNDTALDNVQVERTLGAAPGDVGSAAAAGLARLSASDALDLRFKSDGNDEILSLKHVTLIACRIGD
jgi:hypothetical protein